MDNINWIEVSGESLPVAADAVIHVLTTIDRQASFDCIAGLIKPDAWTKEGFACDSGKRHRVTHYALAGEAS